MTSLDDLLEEVNLLYKGGRYNEMIHLLNEAISVDNMRAELYYFRGLAWSQSKAYDAAIGDFTSAIALKPDYFRAWQLRGITWSTLQKYNKAIDDLTKAITLRPGHISTYLHVGRAWREKKEYDKALPYYDQAIELKPDDPNLYLDRAAIWQAKEAYDLAIEDYNRAIALQPDHASSYAGRGYALLGNKEYGNAIEVFNRAIELRPNYGRAYFGLGCAYEAREEYYTASVHYKRAFFLGFDKTRLVEVFKKRLSAPYIVKSILSGDDNSEKQEVSFSNIAWLMASCGTWDSFFDRLQKSRCPELYPEKYNRLEAIVQYYMGNSIAAYRTFDKKFDSDIAPYPLTIRDQYYLALSAADFMEPDDGLAFAIEQIRTTAPGDDVSNYYAGWLFLLSNDPENALWYFNKCGDFLPAWYGKIAVYKWQGNEAELLPTAEKIADIEAAPVITGGRDKEGGTGFLNGIRPLAVSAEMSFEEMYTGIMQRVHYYELTGEIEEVRRWLNKPPGQRHLEFKALLEINP